MKKSQSGFTLVEIAIVLVIIGLLLGGVLKGQSMVENARVKALAAEFQGVQTMVYAYQDKYRALAGDDAAAVAHQAAATQATAATAGNGRIDTGTWIGDPTLAAANESTVFWNHVRLAGLATGDSTVGQATNAVGGILGITSNTARPTTPANVAGTHAVCSSGINGALAQQLDIAMDDGVGTTGQMFGVVQAAGPIVVATAAAAYAPGNNYTICMVF